MHVEKVLDAPEDFADKTGRSDYRDQDEAKPFKSWL
jgi:hypothetical protein